MKYLLSLLVLITLFGCSRTRKPTSDQIQQQQQETILAEGIAQVGMPAIKNFRERRLVKEILEMRDQEDISTFTYVENTVPTVVRGHTSLGGKYTFVGYTIGYGIPYSTQFTNPEKITYDFQYGSRYNYQLPQADPNGLFSPSSSSGTWILMKQPGKDKVAPAYIESNITVFLWKLPLD